MEGLNENDLDMECNWETKVHGNEDDAPEAKRLSLNHLIKDAAC